MGRIPGKEYIYEIQKVNCYGACRDVLRDRRRLFRRKRVGGGLRGDRGIRRGGRVHRGRVRHLPHCDGADRRYPHRLEPREHPGRQRRRRRQPGNQLGQSPDHTGTYPGRKGRRIQRRANPHHLGEADGREQHNQRRMARPGQGDSGLRLRPGYVRYPQHAPRGMVSALRRPGGGNLRKDDHLLDPDSGLLQGLRPAPHL